ncbi:MAG: dihydropteroate synthase [Solirubrobacterales bacterium]
MIEAGLDPRLESRWRLGATTLSFPPPRVAGIVNVTDDSFYPGARSSTPERAAADGLALVDEGFDLLDVGAVAARSGPPVPAADEAERLVPTVERLASESGVPVLADTFSAEVARRVLDAGAAGINDISGGADPALLELVAETGCGYVLMHIEGPPRADREPRSGGDPVGRLLAWFSERIEAASARGVKPAQVALDPGLDFDLTVDDDLELVRRLGELRELGHPLFVALSRKGFLGAVLAGSWEERAPAEEREAATLAAATLATLAGAAVLRLHDRSALDAVRVAAAIAAQPGRADG